MGSHWRRQRARITSRKHPVASRPRANRATGAARALDGTLENCRSPPDETLPKEVPDGTLADSRFPHDGTLPMGAWFPIGSRWTFLHHCLIHAWHAKRKRHLANAYVLAIFARFKKENFRFLRERERERERLPQALVRAGQLGFFVQKKRFF